MKKITAVVLINEKNQFLLYLRDNKKTIPYPNHWSLLGGHVEKNETLLEALKREIKEEIDYNIEKPIFLDCFEDLVYGTLVYVYKSKINKKLSELNLTEGQKLGYFSFEKVIELKLPEILKNFFINNKNKIFSV